MKRAKRNKEMKSMELFKKGFRKNEIIIYVIALMFVTAGYFNYTANLDKSIETYSENIAVEKQNSVEESKKDENNKSTNISVEKNEDKVEDDKKKEDKQENENITEVKETVATNENKEETKDDEDIGDAKLVSSNNVEKDDYYVSTKLQRDTTYADMISTYTKILQDNSISEPQKAIAMKEITKINDTKNAISICENILSTKGLENFVILVNNDSVNVVVKIKDGLTKNKVAQIQNIVSRELSSKIEDIHITEK